MQHYALFLQAFNYEIKYRNTKLHANADCLSRLPVNNDDKDISDVIDILYTETVETLPINAKLIAEETKKETSLNKIMNALKLDKHLSANDLFGIKQSEFTIHKEVLMRGNRVVIPTKYRKQILHELHTGHLGIVKMKNLARSICWWPEIDKHLDTVTKSCTNCNLTKNNPSKCDTHIWEPATSPFQRIHIDFAGPFKGHNFLILVDAFSKWPEVHLMKNITTETTINKLREIFSTFGLPQILVTDNATTFTSFKFQNFLKVNGIIHKTIAPYNPSTNGQAERFVQTLKKSMKNMVADGDDLNLALQKFLLSYRVSAHQGTGISPSARMFGRKIRTRLDQIHPDYITQKHYYKINDNNRCRNLKVGERVIARNYLGENKWCFGTIERVIGKLHYSIRLDSGIMWKRHINQLRIVETPNSTSDLEIDFNWPVENDQIIPTASALSKQQASAEEITTASNSDICRRPERVKRPPARYRN